MLKNSTLFVLLFFVMQTAYAEGPYGGGIIMAIFLVQFIVVGFVLSLLLFLVFKNTIPWLGRNPFFILILSVVLALMYLVLHIFANAPVLFSLKY